jgi:hypothetical protein
MIGDIKFKTFYLLRKEDVSGISSTGIVAHGIEMRSGLLFLEWIANEHVSWGLYPNETELLSIHGHENRTQLIWITEKD